MKTNSLLVGAFLIVAAGGCNSAYYGPASPDFYPADGPPFTNAAVHMPPLHKTAAVKTPALPAVQTAAQPGSRTDIQG